MRLVYTVIMSRIGRIFPLVDGLGVNRNNVYQKVLSLMVVVCPVPNLGEQLEGVV
jgi:hypothetical protein